MIVAGVGRREGLLRSTMSYIEAVGAAFAERGHICISGGAAGTDSLFIDGAQLAGAETWIFRPECNAKELQKYEVIPRCRVFYATKHASVEDLFTAQDCHPAWGQCSAYVKNLMIRNAMMARACQLVVSFPDVNRRGWSGTGHMLRCAMRLAKPALAFADGTWFRVIWNSRGELNLSTLVAPSGLSVLAP